MVIRIATYCKERIKLANYHELANTPQLLEASLLYRKVYKLVTMENSYLNKYLEACARESKVYVSLSCGLIICKIVTTKPIQDHKFWADTTNIKFGVQYKKHSKLDSGKVISNILLKHQAWTYRWVNSYYRHILSNALGTT